MSRAKLEEFKKRIDELFNTEAKIMLDLLKHKDCLTKKEKSEYTSYIKNHRFIKFKEELEEMNKKLHS